MPAPLSRCCLCLYLWLRDGVTLRCVACQLCWVCTVLGMSYRCPFAVAVQSNNDYAMRMRDIAFQERLKKMTERYTTDLDHNREQYDLLREEKMDLEHEFSERLKAMEITHQSEMQKRESLYQSQCACACTLGQRRFANLRVVRLCVLQTRSWRRWTGFRSCSWRRRLKRIASERSSGSFSRRTSASSRCAAALVTFTALPRGVVLHHTPGGPRCRC